MFSSLHRQMGIISELTLQLNILKLISPNLKWKNCSGSEKERKNQWISSEILPYFAQKISPYIIHIFNSPNIFLCLDLNDNIRLFCMLKTCLVSIQNKDSTNVIDTALTEKKKKKQRKSLPKIVNTNEWFHVALILI